MPYPFNMHTLFSLMVLLNSSILMANCQESLNTGKAAHESGEKLMKQTRLAFDEVLDLEKNSAAYCKKLKKAEALAVESSDAFFMGQVAYSQAFGMCSVELKESSGIAAGENEVLAEKQVAVTLEYVRVAQDELKYSGCLAENLQ